MKTSKMLVALLALGLIPAPAFAQDNPTEKREEVVKEREQKQEQRIEQGEQSGQLTGKEAKKLEKEQSHVKNLEQKAEADGKVTKKEFARIEKAQNHASKDIERKKHNKRVKPTGTN